MSHVTKISERHFLSFEVVDGAVCWEEIYNHSQSYWTPEEAEHAIWTESVGSFPLSLTEPMELPVTFGGWLAVHPITGVLRCHKHRRNARKWMERPHSDFMLCK